MKYLKFWGTIFLLCIVMVNGCSKSVLNRPVPGSLTVTDLANKAGVEGLLIGAYSLLDGIGSPQSSIYSAASNWTYGSVCGSEAYTGSDRYDEGADRTIETFSATSIDQGLESKWSTVYDGVARSNEVLRVMAQAKDISSADQKRIAAEARFLRGFYHLEAKKIWNNIPYIDETVTYAAGNYYVNNRDSSSWLKIENDFKFAINNLADTPYKQDVGRASKYPAMAFLAKVYMFQNKFDSAKILLDSIIGSNKYQLVNNYHDNFDPATKNNSESVFSVQSSVNGYSFGQNGNLGDADNFPTAEQGAPGLCCGFFQPSQYLVNHFKTDTNGLPDIIHFNDNNVTNDDGISSDDSSFVPYGNFLDPRLDWTVGRRGIPYLDWGNHPGQLWIRDQAYSGPYSPKKNIYAKNEMSVFVDASNSQATANNVNLIRYADVLLWAAEAEAWMGNLDKSEDYVNMIRNRAANQRGWVYLYIDPNDPSKGFSNIPAANYRISKYPAGYFQSVGQAYALKAIYYERMLELGMEGHRFFDLVRWGIADVEINNYLKVEDTSIIYLKPAVFIKGCSEYFAIPQTQIDLSINPNGVHAMIQNPCH